MVQLQRDCPECDVTRPSCRRITWLMPFDVRDFPDIPSRKQATAHRNRGIVAIWLLVVAGMILVMVVLGGVTRLTGSGLSIMEWAPVSGV